MKEQADINERMRAILVDWLVARPNSQHSPRSVHCSRHHAKCLAAAQSRFPGRRLPGCCRVCDLSTRTRASVRNLKSRVQRARLSEQARLSQDVHVKFKLRAQTMHLTVTIIDRYLSRQPCVRKRLQLVRDASAAFVPGLPVCVLVVAARILNRHRPSIVSFIPAVGDAGRTAHHFMASVKIYPIGEVSGVLL